MIYSQQQCRLFNLPPELRNNIYDYVLSHRELQQEFSQTQKNPGEHRISFASIRRNIPSNELLQTCCRIHDEGRGIFVRAQREFWSKKVFVIELKDNWKDVKADTSHGMQLSDLSNTQTNLIPKFIVAVQAKDNHCQYHFVESEDYGFGCALDLEASHYTAGECRQLFQAELRAYSKHLKELVRLNKDFNAVNDYSLRVCSYIEACRRGEKEHSQSHTDILQDSRQA